MEKNTLLSDCLGNLLAGSYGSRNMRGAGYSHEPDDKGIAIPVRCAGPHGSRGSSFVFFSKMAVSAQIYRVVTDGNIDSMD